MRLRFSLLIATAALTGLAVPAAADHRPGHTPGSGNITIAATPTTVKFGGSVTLSGKLTGSNNASRPVTIEQDPFPVDTFTTAGTATTNATGDWTFAHKPAVNTRYQARSGGADSQTVDVMVRPAITLRLSDRTPRRGQRVRFSGRLCPEHDGVAIALQRRFGTTWRTLRKPVLKDVAGSTCSSFSQRLRVRRDGAYRARFLGDADHVAGNSRVRRANVG
jgi:hypothetical protein